MTVKFKLWFILPYLPLSDGVKESDQMQDLMDETQNSGEMITGSDFKRMIRGAFSEILLMEEEINAWANKLPIFLSHCPGSDISRTIAAAVLPLENTSDDSIGGLARLAASAAFLGARGTAGVMVASILRGLAKGLSSYYEVTNSQFGRAFQYGILYVQRAIAVGEKDVDAGVVQAARQVAKNARAAVRENLPINDILEAALAAAEQGDENETFGQFVMRLFLRGCKHGLDGNFVSPLLAAGVSGRGVGAVVEAAKSTKIDIFCINLKIVPANPFPKLPEMIEKSLSPLAGHVEASLLRNRIVVHAHTAEPGKVIEHCLAWGTFEEISLVNMAEPHALKSANYSLLNIAVIAITDDENEMETLQKAGAQVIVTLKENESLSVGTLVGACHSDLASSYIIVGYSNRLTLLLRQVKYLLDRRVEIIFTNDKKEQLAAIKAFKADNLLATARDCAKAMLDAVETLRNSRQK